MSNKPIALITGGAQGIGYACAEAIANDGAQIVLADINAAGVKDAAVRLAEVTATDVLGIQCDMGDPEQIDALFARIENELGFVSMLVNNAGIAKPASFLEVSLKEFQEVINVNLIGTFYASQRAAKSMVSQQIKGSIVNMSSINAQEAIPSIAAYCASKGGVMQLTKSSSLALAPHGIRVNAVGPG